MVRKHVAIGKAYTILGLENDASSEEVKSAYKKLAMKTHPEKNPDVPDATEKFQEIGAAYNTLMRHFDRLDSAPLNHGAFWGSDYADEMDDSDYDSSDDEPDMGFYIFVYDNFVKGDFRSSNIGFSSRLRRQWDAPETDERYNDRFRRQCEEQEADKKRRAMEEKRRKERIKEEKERERAEAEERQKQRILKKKEKAEMSKQNSAQKARSQQEQTQLKRSAMFAAARGGDFEAVKRGIWEDSLDAAGGEIKVGCDAFVPQAPKDPAETLLHIAASHGDVELVEWLVNHNAEPDERNSAGLTALHVALRKGYTPIVQYFFKNLPPKDADYQDIYSPPASTNLLQLAMETFEPELVWMVLDNKLANESQVKEAWSTLCANSSEEAADGNGSSGKREVNGYASREKEIKNLLMTYGGLTPPPTPNKDAPAVVVNGKRTVNAPLKKPKINTGVPNSAYQNPTPNASPVSTNRSYQSSPVSPDGSVGHPNGRGQSHRRARVHGRGRGRGRGQR